jgi:hypothetical protein
MCSAILIPVILYIRSGSITYKVLMCACVEVLKLGKFDASCAETKFGLFSAYGIFIHRKGAKARGGVTISFLRVYRMSDLCKTPSFSCLSPGYPGNPFPPIPPSHFYWSDWISPSASPLL